MISPGLDDEYDSYLDIEYTTYISVGVLFYPNMTYEEDILDILTLNNTNTTNITDSDDLEKKFDTEKSFLES